MGVEFFSHVVIRFYILFYFIFEYKIISIIVKIPKINFKKILCISEHYEISCLRGHKNDGIDSIAESITSVKKLIHCLHRTSKVITCLKDIETKLEVVKVQLKAIDIEKMIVSERSRLSQK